MNKTVIEVQVRAVLPTSGGCAVFIGNNDKVFIIYVDQTVGSAITMFMREISKERPLTHDLMAHLMTALGAKVERVIINDLKNATYYARAIIRAENELQQKAVLIDWADSSDPRHRGLVFGSDRAIFDEHFDQRGRFGRLVNIVAQSADHFGGADRLGLGEIGRAHV